MKPRTRGIRPTKIGRYAHVCAYPNWQKCTIYHKISDENPRKYSNDNILNLIEVLQAVSSQRVHFLNVFYKGVLIVHGLYCPFSVSIYPFLGCNFCERRIHIYLMHVMHELLFLVLMNWVPYLFPLDFFFGCSTSFPVF